MSWILLRLNLLEAKKQEQTNNRRNTLQETKPKKEEKGGLPLSGGTATTQGGPALLLHGLSSELIIPDSAESFELQLGGDGLHTPPPPRRKYYENNLPTICLCNFWGRLRQNCVITKKLIPQDLFCVIDDRRDLRLVNVELREIYVTPKKIFLREFVCVIDYAKPSQSPRK